MDRELEAGGDAFGMEMGDASDLRIGAGPSGSKKQGSKFPVGIWAWAIGGAAAVFLVGFFLGSGSGAGPGSSADLESLTARVTSLENEVRRIEAMEDRVVNVERMGTGIRQSFDRWQDAEKSLLKRLNELSEDVKRLEKKAVVYAPEIKAPAAAASKPPAAGAESGKKARYHKVTSGDTLYRISIKYGITVDELCRLNNINRKQVIRQGQMLLISQGE